MTYTYGTTGLDNGMVTQVTDGLSSVSQTFSYQPSGGGIGQLASTSQTLGTTTSSQSYTYNAAGDRDTATYTTSQGVTKWGYSDYIRVGSPDKPQRVFQTLNKLDANGNPTSEEFHYQYNTAGRLTNAAFAQTPWTGYEDYSALAHSRALAFYDYEPGGRLLELRHLWQTTATNADSAFTLDHVLLGNLVSYNGYTGLKTQDDLYKEDTAPTNWTLDHSERFGYDAKLDTLTSASYDGGLNTTNWSYDAAGNRNDATVVDNLNRATTIGGVSRTYDLLGNTTAIGTKTMNWDALNRMTSYIPGGGNPMRSYAYRADGMRVRKGQPTNPGIYTDYAYDGQMPIEEYNYQAAYPSFSTIKVIRYGLGARGIDRIERVPAQGATLVGYPVYDDHGNMIATLMRSGSNQCTLNDRRSYDAWGGVRTGNTTGEPHGRYCANLGHLADDESGFTYMRARYYEPGTGRFVSEDPGRDGGNWFSYCGNDPVSRGEYSGRKAGWIGAISEFVRELLRSAGTGEFPSWKALFKVTFKTAWGIQEGYVSAWAVRALKNILELTQDAYMKAMETGAGFRAESILDAGAYACVLILFIDAIDIGAGDGLRDALADFIFGDRG